MGDAPGSDPVWERALDWLLVTRASPHDSRLRLERDAWLAEHEAHRQAYRRAEKVWLLTGDVPPAHAEHWSAAALPADRRRPSRRRVVGLAAGAVAASLALAVTPAVRVRVQADHRTGTGETRRVGLPDGSVVDLDAQSAVTVDFTPAGRGVRLLEGQAFFDVVKDAARPFTVAADEVTVTVVGTAFNVRLADDTVSVAVRTGIVTVDMAEAGRVPSPTPSARLMPGERLTLSRQTGSVMRDAIIPDRISAWREGRLVVDGVTVAEVIDTLRRHHTGLIQLRDAGLGARKVTGVFDLKDPVSALKAAVRPHGGRVREPLPSVLVIDARPSAG
jgi:transmembrane sensor